MSNPGPAVTTGTGLQNLSTNQGLRLLCYKKAIDVNVAGDNAMPLIATSLYSVATVILANGSTSLTTARAGIYTLASAGGTAVVADAALSTVNSTTAIMSMTVASTPVKTVPNLYFRVSTVQGAAATVDCYVYGYDFS